MQEINTCLFPALTWDLILFPSIAELKENKARVFSKRLCNNIFYDVVSYERMNNWVILTQNSILLYCPFHIIQKITFLSSTLIPCLIDHQIKMLKKEKRERFPHSQFPHCYVLCLRVICTLAWVICTFFP